MYEGGIIGHLCFEGYRIAGNFRCQALKAYFVVLFCCMP